MQETEVYIDQFGGVWSAPTPEAYSRTCQALARAHEELNALREKLEETVQDRTALLRIIRRGL